MNWKFKFLSIFREFFIYHHKSLEFRAKVFAAMICAKELPSESDFEDLKEIGKEIYKDDMERILVLIQMVKIYVEKVKQENFLTLDSLLLDIDKMLKENKRFVKKLDFAHLRKFMLDSDENDALVQQRVYEFFLSEAQIYAQGK